VNVAVNGVYGVPVALTPVVGTPSSDGLVTGNAVFTETAGRALTYTAPRTSTGGGVVRVDATTGAFVYLPTLARRGAATDTTTDTFTITASNGLTTATQTVTVPVLPGVGCGDNEICDPAGSRQQGRYTVFNGQWGDLTALQCIKVGDNGFRISHLIRQSADTKQIVGYPSVQLGCIDWVCSPDRTLPIALGNLHTAVSTVNFEYVDGGVYRAAYDIFLHPPASAPTTKPDPRYEIMIFLHSEDTTTTYPVVEVDGRQWQLNDRNPPNWLSGSGYRAPISMSGGTFDIKAFIDDVRSRHPEITDDWTLNYVAAGFEVWSGGEGLGVTSFDMTVT
jgi:hypothetical protein